MEKIILERSNGNQAHDVHLAAEIFAKYGELIREFIRFKVVDENSVDDLYQNFFLSLVSRPPPGDVKNFKSYLYRAIMNDIIDFRRCNGRYQNLMHRYVEYCAKFEDCPEDKLIENEETNKILESIEKRLKKDEAEAVILRYRRNYKIKEIATTMGINNIAAWRYISKGVQKIKWFLRKGQL